MIYFLRFGDGLIKIGTTLVLRRRLDQIRTSPNYGDHEVIKVIVGGREEERGLHVRFAHLRVRDALELFRPGPDLLEFIAIREDMGTARLLLEPAVKDPDRRHVNWRIRRDVCAALKQAAALDRTSSEKYAEELLARDMAGRGLLALEEVDSMPVS